MTNEVLLRLDPAERDLAKGMRGRRQIEFTGGRLAWRAISARHGPLRTGKRGEPLCPEGLSVSLTHKQDLAIALVGKEDDGTLGLDLEGDARERMTIGERVLRPEELEVVRALPAAEQWRAVLLRFALKEAAYKAIHPHLLRFVGFQEARVTLGAQAPTVEIVTEPTLVLQAGWEALDAYKVLATVRAKRR